MRTTLEDRWRRRQKREEADREIVSNLVAGAPDLSSATSDLCGIFVAGKHITSRKIGLTFCENAPLPDLEKSRKDRTLKRVYKGRRNRQSTGEGENKESV